MRATLLMFLMLTSACYGGLVLEEYMNDNNISQRTNVLGGPGNIFLQNHRVTIRVDATNIALNCVVVSSSTQNTTNTPYKSVNGNTNADVMKTNRWESRQKNNGGSLQEWIMFDLGATKSFNYFKIWWEGAYATSYAFQVSDDKINWTTVYTNGAGGGGTEEQHFSMATGRYVKMLCLKKVNDNFGYSFYEIKLFKRWYDQIVASSVTGGNIPSNLADGNSSSRWESLSIPNGGANDQWLYFDFGEKKQFNLVTILWENAYAKSYKLQVSDDGISWDTVYMKGNLWITNNRPDLRNGGLETLPLPNQTKRFLKVYCYERFMSDQGYSIYEMNVYSTKYTNTGVIKSTNYAPPYFSAWKKLYYNVSIPSSCNVNVTLLNAAGTVKLASTPLVSGFNSIDISSLTATTSNLSVKFDLHSNNDFSTPILFNYALTWDTSTNYLKLFDLKLTAQNSKVTADGKSQQHDITLKWGPNGAASLFRLWRGIGVYSEADFIQNMSTYQNTYTVAILSSSTLTYVDTIPDVENEYFYVLMAQDQNGYSELSNPVKIISYPVTEQQGWVWLPSNWLWREGEEWDSKDTDGAIEYRTTASAGACLGSSWGGWATYNIYVDQTMSDAHLYLRYASMGPHQMDIYVDNIKLYTAFQCLDTLDWGVFAFSSVSLGALSAGKHTIKLDPNGNFNFDGFYVYNGTFDPNNVLSSGKLVPPSPWKQRKITITEVSNLTAPQTADAQNNPMISNPALIVASTFSVEGFDSVFFHKVEPVSLYFTAQDIPAGVSVDKLSIFSWNGSHWIKMGSKLESSSGSYTLTASVNNYSTYAVFESEDFSPLKKAWWTYNPFSPNGDGICDETELQFFLKTSGLVIIRIYDLQGRFVKTLLDGTQELSGNIISVKWDGKDNYGHALESGVYLYQVESSGLDTPKGVINGTIVIVR